MVENGVLLMKKLAELLKENDIKLTIAVYPYPSQVWYEDLHSIQVHICEEWALENDVNFINHFPDFIVIEQDNEEKLKTLKIWYDLNDLIFPYTESYIEKINWNGEISILAYDLIFRLKQGAQPTDTVRNIFIKAKLFES